MFSRPLSPADGAGLLFAFFVLRVRPAPSAVLLQFYLALDELPVLARPVVRAPALRTSQFYELILGHEALLYPVR